MLSKLLRLIRILEIFLPWNIQSKESSLKSSGKNMKEAEKELTQFNLDALYRDKEK